jgi:hypothetical protein
MAVFLSPIGGAGWQFFNNDGFVLSGGKIYTYLAGTSTPATTYTTSAGSIAHSNPIILDSSGRVPSGEIWLTDSVAYKFVLKDSNNNLIGTYDNILSFGTINACNVVYQANFTGSVPTTVCKKLEEFISVSDFGANGNGIVDNTAAFQNAVNAVGAGGIVYVFTGNYLISGTVTGSNMSFYFVGNVIISGGGTLAGNITQLTQYGESVGRDYDWRTLNSQQSALVVGEHVALQQDDPSYLATLRIFPEGDLPSPTQIAIEPFWITSVNDLNSVGNGEDITSMLCGASSPVVPGGGEERGGWIFKNRTGGADYRHHQITSFATLLGTVRPIQVVLGDKNLQKYDYASGSISFDNADVLGTVSKGNTVINYLNSPSTNGMRLTTRSNGASAIIRLISGAETMEARVGEFGIGLAGAGGIDPAARVETTNSEASLSAEIHNVTNASYAGEVIKLGSVRTANTAFSYLTARSDTAVTNDLEFNLRGDGNAFADGTWTGGGADYAEYFEWEDGNLNDEDRVGMTVALSGNKIKIAEQGDDPIGVVSATAVVVGDSAWNKWNQKYLQDDFGRIKTKKQKTVQWIETIDAVTEQRPIEHERAIVGKDGKPDVLKWTSIETFEIQPKKTITHSYLVSEISKDIVIPSNAIYEEIDVPILNPLFDETQTYIPRENRKEWSPIGLVGKLRMKKNQITSNNWKKMRDISNEVEEWLIK